MQNEIHIYNTLTRKKEKFVPIHPPHVGLYVCGPTVYGDAHLGHARSVITFDVLFRYLRHLGFKVRYVRNITDVGHLENELEDEGEDKISKAARLEQLEPMEVVQQYVNHFQQNMKQLNVLPPSIEPHASGHIIEQQELVKKILKNGFGYEVNGSIYFDVEKYDKLHHYGRLSGRKTEDLQSNTRKLEGQEEKRNSYDFALWKKSTPAHIMHWPSIWSEGFPGWHLECSAMSMKYLGDVFDIHGGGLDLMFPHHECEIAQSVAANGKDHVRYWMHNNMITINGQKMGKSLNNSISLNEFFSGDHPSLDRAFSPMTIRFFILQAHYRSTLDFSNEALDASEKGLERLLKALETLEKLQPSEKSSIDIQELEGKCYAAINDDLNTPIAISYLFDGVKLINLIKENKETITQPDLEQMKTIYQTFVSDIFGLKTEEKATNSDNLAPGLIELLLDLRKEAKARKDFGTSDSIRKQLNSLGIEIKDTKDGVEWEIKD
jgi:cysteinyl-tRNA synthetase